MQRTIDFQKCPDPKGAKLFTEIVNRVAPNWRPGTSDVLKVKNPELLEKMDKIESRLNSLLAIAGKPKELEKKQAETLDEYERAVNIAIAYAARHLPQQP